MKRAVMVVVILLVLALVGAGLLNVLADSAPIREMGRLRACATLAERIKADAKAIRGKDAKVTIPECDLYMARETKTFFGMTFDFLSKKHQGHDGNAVKIGCARAYVFVGAYACQAE